RAPSPRAREAMLRQSHFIGLLSGVVAGNDAGAVFRGRCLALGELVQQPLDAGYPNDPRPTVNQPPLTQIGDGPGEGFRLDRQARGNQALGQYQFDLGAVGPAIANLSYQVERQALGGILQGQVLQLVQALVQAHAHVAQQVQAGVGVLLQMAQHQLVGKAYEANRLQGLGTYRKHRTLHEHDGFGEGVACGNDLDDLFLAVSGNAVELDLATLHQIEALGRIALALDQALWRVLPYLGIGQQF